MFKRRPLQVAIVILTLTMPVTSDILAQPDRTSFVTAPFMQRAYEAERASNWQAVIDATSQALNRAEQLHEARLLRLQAYLNLGQYHQAETDARLLPPEQRAESLTQVRNTWMDQEIPPAAALARWQDDLSEADWLNLVQISSFRREQEVGRQAAADYLNEVYRLTQSPAVAQITMSAYTESVSPAVRYSILEQQAADNTLNDDSARAWANAHLDTDRLSQALRRIDNAKSASWYPAFRQGLLDRLIANDLPEAAKTVIMRGWSFADMPDDVRQNLIQLAIDTEDLVLMSRPDLRPQEACMDSVAWLAERDTERAGTLLAACEADIDPERWNYLASLYRPDLLPEIPADDMISDPAAEAEALRLAAEQEAAEARLRDAQRVQDALDNAYTGQCDLSGDALFDGIRDQVTAICLSEATPGAAAVYYQLALSDVENGDRQQQLLREAAYNAYNANDFQLALQYWQQVNNLTADDQAAIAVTEAAIDALQPADPETVVYPTVEELQELAEQNPRDYALELGLRLAGDEDEDRREMSIDWLEQSRQYRPYDFRIPESLAYRYFESDGAEAAAENARLAIDKMDINLSVGEATPDNLKEREFALRRTHQFITQRNRWYIGSNWSRFGAVNGIGVSAADSAFQIASFEHLLGDEPTEAGRQLGVYGRVLGSSNNNSDFFQNRSYGVGFRWKPIGDANFSTYVEYFWPHEGRDDILVRAAGSLFDGGKFRDDWRPLRSHWQWQSLYLDAVYYLKGEYSQLYGSYIRGIAYKLSEDTPHTLSPYVTVYSGRTDDYLDSAVGFGLRYRLWMDEDRYSAWRDRIDIRAEISHSFDGARRGATGWRIISEFLL